MAGNTQADKALVDSHDPTNHALRVQMAADPNIEIGKIVIKDDTAATTAKVGATASAIATSDPVLAVQASVLGLEADAAVTTNAVGTISAKLRGLIAIALDVLGVSTGVAVVTDAAGSIQQYLRGLVVMVAALKKTTSTAAEGDPSLTVQAPVLGATTGVAVTTDANGTLQQYLRGIIVKMVDVLGVSTGAAVITSATGSIQQYLRGIVAIFADVLGVSTGAAVVTSTTGTIQGYLRGFIALWNLGLTAGEAHIGAVGGALVPIVATFTRPGDATPYTALDAVNNSTSAPAAMQFTTAGRITAGNGGAGSGYITGVEIIHEIISITPRLRLHLFNTSPTLANDNAAYAPTYAITSAAGYLGTIDLVAMTSNGLTDASRAQDLTIRVPYKCAASSQIIYALIQTLDAFTPGNAKSFAVKLWFDQN